MRCKYYLKARPDRPVRNTIFDITRIVYDIPEYTNELQAFTLLLGAYGDRFDAICKLIQLMLYAVPGNQSKLMAGDIRGWVAHTLSTIPSNKRVLPQINSIMLEIGRRMFINSGYHQIVGDRFFSPESAIVFRVQQYTGPRFNVMYCEKPTELLILKPEFKSF